ncbi:ATP-dependent RNA helicase dhx29, partial [Mortierella sp. GBA43]
MPPKKKNKNANANARGFATTSIPKAKPVVVEEPEPEPELFEIPAPTSPDQAAVDNITPQENEDAAEDEYVVLADRIENVTLRRVDAFLGQAQKVNVEVLPVLKMESKLEHNVVALLKQAGAKNSGEFLSCDVIFSLGATEHSFRPNLNLTKEEAVTKINVTYLMLLRLGFEKKDVEEALQHTYTGESEDALDWLCMNLDPEKLPRGFADKFYHDEEMKISVLAQPSKQEKGPVTIEQDTLRVDDILPEADLDPVPTTNTTTNPETSADLQAEERDDRKKKILESALAVDSEEEEDPNELYAIYKMELKELTKSLAESPSNKKVISQKMDSLESKLRDLDLDMNFDKKMAEAAFKRRFAGEEKKSKAGRKRPKDNTPKPLVWDEGPLVEENDADTDIFASIWDMESMNEIPGPPQRPMIARRRSMANSSWTGKSPKAVLEDFCRKTDRHAKVSYKEAPRSTIAACMSTVTVKWGSGSISTTEMTEEGCENRTEADNYAATLMLYELTSLPMYRQLPPTYRDLWLERIYRKENAELLAKKAIDGDRLSFIKALTARLPSRESVVTQEESKQFQGHQQFVNRKKKNVVTPAGRTLRDIWNRRTDMPHYKILLEKRKELPMYQFREQFLTMIAKHQVVIVSGETGCGKSTQVPQYLVEYMLGEGLGDQCDIMCTQPRRISAISIANRVSEELGDGRNSAGRPGTLVGYQIRLESRVEPSNVLKFCTTGILLRRLESDSLLKGVTHLVIDEVHERSLDSDFLLVILQRLLPRRPDLKVILMSATLDSARFSQYFNFCPVLDVPGRTFPVHPHFLEDVIEATKYTLEEDSEYAIRYRKDVQSKGSVDVAGKGASRQTVYLQWENDADDYIPQEADARVSLTDGSPYTPAIQNQTAKMLRRIDENKVNYDLIQLLLEYICFPEDRRKPQNQGTSEADRLPETKDTQKPDTVESSVDSAQSKDPSDTKEGGVDSSTLEGQTQDSSGSAPVNDSSEPARAPEEGSQAQDPPKDALPEEGAKAQDPSPSLGASEEAQGQDPSHSIGAPESLEGAQDQSIPESVLFPLENDQEQEDSSSPFRIPREGQSQVFDIPPPGVRKIVLATNIAETGITIPDVTIVIDTGRAKQVKFDEKKRVSTLQERFISKASARQRRGRAGRVQEGVCFHLFSKPTFDEYMPEFLQPEIMRMPLEELCLMIKMCKLGDITEVLRSALDAPSKEAIENAILALQEVHALDDNQDLTPLGTHLCNLPVDVHIGKMILFGSIFKCLDPILTIAAMLSFKSPFVKPFGAEAESDAAKARFKLADSDMLTWFNAYLGWRKTYQEKTSGIYDYCRENFLSHQNLVMIEDMKKQFLGFLVGTGFVKVDMKTKRLLNQEHEQYSRRIQFCPVIPEYNVYERSIPVMNAAIAAGMYPKVMMRNDKGYVTGSKQETLWIHPSSVNHAKGGVGGAAVGPDVSPWFVYNSLVKSSRMYVWESCRVGQFPLVLFGRELAIKHHAKLVTVDDWVKFKCHAKTAVVFKMMRDEM